MSKNKKKSFNSFMRENGKIIIPVAVGALLLIVIIVFILNNQEPSNTLEIEIDPDELSVDESEINTLADGTKYIIHPDNIRRGIGAPGDIKDKIPSIDSPKFVTVAEADDWIEDDELILVFKKDDVTRVYPFQILVWHEIVNDEINGEPILITYCPLCGSGIVYERKIQGEEVEFGTSGKLYNTNLIMYDRRTETYWQQIGGMAILGPLTGLKLKLLDSNVVGWGEFKNLNPDAEVLSQNTGFPRSYGRDPYGNYNTDSGFYFPVDEQDTKSGIHPKNIVFGIEINGVFKAYREDDIIASGNEIEDQVNGVNIKVERAEDGIVTITNTDTGEIIPKERDMWFAWFVFHTDTEIYGYDKDFNRII